MTAVLLSKSNNPSTAELDTSINLATNNAERSTLSTTSKLSPTTSETENEPRPSIVINKKQDTMPNQEDLILNTNFDFHAFSSQHLSDEADRANKRGVIDHVLDNGERVVVVDPNVSDDEEHVEEVVTVQQSPLDKAISSLFAAASNQSSCLPRKRVSSPKPKTVSGILAAKRRKVETPQKRASEPDFTALSDSFSAASTSSFLSALASSNSSRRKPTSTRPSSSNSDLTTSKSSLSDSGIVSADEQPLGSPIKQEYSTKMTKFGKNESSIPAPVLQLLINAAGGDSTNLSELLTSDPILLKTITDAISANPSQQHTLQIVPAESIKPEIKTETNAQCFSVQSSTNPKTAQQYPSAEQIGGALALWPGLLSTVSKLDEQTAAKLLGSVTCNTEQSTSTTLNNNEESRVHSEDEEDNQQEELLRLGGEWLLRELFKGKALEKPRQQPIQAVRKRKFEIGSPQIKSSESVVNQLKHKGHKQIAELEELEQFASHFKRQRIKHGFTQGDVGVALGRRFGSDFSQTTISRFEALNLSFKNMCKLRPLMEEWLTEAEAAIQRGFTVSDIVEADALKNTHEAARPESADSASPVQLNPESFGAKANSTDIARVAGLVSSLSPTNSNLPGLNSVLPTLKKRRKRTNLDNQQKERLDTYFVVNPRPDHQQMLEIANELDLDSDVIRVWFCNRRQKLRK